MRMEIMLLNNGTGSSTKILIDKSSIINSLDKDQTSYDDLLDAFRLSLKGYNRWRNLIMENYFKGSRICKYCDINMDIRDLDMLYFFHDTCWQEYGKNGEVYPMPKHED